MLCGLKKISREEAEKKLPGWAREDERLYDLALGFLMWEVEVRCSENDREDEFPWITIPSQDGLKLQALGGAWNLHLQKEEIDSSNSLLIVPGASLHLIPLGFVSPLSDCNIALAAELGKFLQDLSPDFQREPRISCERDIADYF